MTKMLWLCMYVSHGLSRLILDEGEDNGFSGSKHARPINDENAPDLYIPLMAFITYTLLTGYVKGTKDSFTPEVLVQVRPPLPPRHHQLS